MSDSPEPNHGLQRLCWTAVAIVIFLGLFFRWYAGNTIEADLQGYGKTIRNAHCSLEEKERLLDRVEAIEDRLRHGTVANPIRWSECNEAVTELLKGSLTSDKVILIERELRRYEKQLSEAETDPK